MLFVKCGNSVSYEKDTETSEPLVLFDLESIGIDHNTFLGDLRSTFENLEWDFYDVRREQLTLLQAALPSVEFIQSVFKPFYAGEVSLETLLSSFPALPSSVLEAIGNVTPYRRRSTAKINLTLEGSGRWDVTRLPNDSIVQQVVSSDYRSIPRAFKETAVEVIEHPEFDRLLQEVGNLVLGVKEKVTMLELTCWQTGIVAKPHRSGTNSPEGIHQDGADFIVSALVIDRENISGGTSRVFGPDRSTEHLEVTLQPGQGIFQADAGSSLWHDVTPVKVENPEFGTGVRNLFGFDINVKETKR